MYWLYLFLFIHRDRANNKTTTSTRKRLINSENPRGRRPVACRIAGKDPPARTGPNFINQSTYCVLSGHYAWRVQS
ncbi:hypothetical protein D7V57_12210 [Escherichia coli]|nr:hypothetical protein [Escherichia coli]